MAYATGRVILNHRHHAGLIAWCDDMGHKANNLGNAALFRLRNHMAARQKDVLTPNEQEVEAEINKTMAAYPKKERPKSVISYTFLEKMMRVTKNPDYFAGLPMQTAQHILKERNQDMRNFFGAVQAYKKNPSAFTGRLKPPKYWKSGGTHTFSLTNQDCLIKKDSSGRAYLKFPLTKEILYVETLPDDASLKEVRVCPYYDTYKVLYTYETENASSGTGDLVYAAAVDLGVDNTIAAVTNEGYALLVKGGAVKAANQWFNKQRAFYMSEVTRGKPTTYVPSTRQLAAISMNRAQFLEDHFHQLSAFFVRWCLAHRVGTVVIGETRLWKQGANIGHRNNQAFVGIPFDRLKAMIAYKAERAGIRVLYQEESYTSKASFLDNDYIPVYGKDDKDAVFSGKRISRGFYRSGDSTVINADINGAANILRKAGQAAFAEGEDFSFLKNPETVSFYGLHKRTPAKGIAAA